MSDLPKDKNKAFTINGIRYANREKYDKRLKDDMNNMAAFLYDIYQTRGKKCNGRDANASTS